MEAFALLSYWCTTGGAAALSNARRTTKPPAAASTYGFDGPYFDLDFTSESENGDELRFSFDSDESDKQIVKSAEATEFRVLLLDLRKTKSDSKLGENDERENQGRRPLVSLFAIDESNICEEFKHIMRNSETNSRNLGKQMLQKYLNVLKPLYIQMKLSGAIYPAAAEKGRSNVKSRNNLRAVVRKHLGKIRPTSPVAPPPENMGPSPREAEDGIQGAILHCKKSFNFQ